MKPTVIEKEKWNENIETCEECGIEWKKIDKQCPVCFRRNKNDKKFKIKIKNV